MALRPVELIWPVMPIWVMCGCILALVTDRYAPNSSGALTLMLLAIATPLVVPRVGLAEAHTRWLVGVSALFALWMLVPNLLEPIREAAWWRLPERAAALLALIGMLSSGLDSRRVIAVCGAAAGLTVITAMMIDWLHSDLLSVGFFGFGHPNYLLNPAGPILLGWTVMVGLDWRSGKAPRLSEAMLMAASWIALASACWITGRRGVPVALVAGIIGMAWMTLWKHRPRLALMLIPLAAAALVTFVTLRYQTSVGGYRQERLLQYQASWDTALQKLPWGGGSFAEADIIANDSEASRHMTATGGYALHAHNEPLDILVSGGIPGIVLALVITGLVLWRLFRITDGTLQIAWCGVMGAIATHLITDPTFGQDVGQAWLAIMIAGLFLAPAIHGRCSSPRLPAVKLLTWALAAICTWGATRSIYPAIVHREASPEVYWKAGSAALHPQWSNLYLIELIHGKDIRQHERPVLLDMYERKLGPHPAVIGPRAMLSYAVPSAAVRATLDLIRILPFDRRGYGQLDRLVKKDPGLMTLVPQTTQIRLRRLVADPGMPIPDVQRPIRAIDDAIDVFSECVWLLDSGQNIQEVSSALERLTTRYGNVPDVGQLCLEAAIAHPDRFEWIQGRAVILMPSVAKRLPEISLLIQDPDDARGGAKFFRWLFPEVFTDFERHRVPVWVAADGASVNYLALVRVWNLENRAKRAAAPAGKPSLNR